MVVTITADEVRAMLGPFGGAWTDPQIMANAIQVPAWRGLLELCPGLDDVVDVDAVALLKLAMASQVAANLIMASPRFSVSRLRDSSVTFAKDSELDRATVLLEQARSLIDDICPAISKPATVALFRLARGRRGQ